MSATRTKFTVHFTDVGKQASSRWSFTGLMSGKRGGGDVDKDKCDTDTNSLSIAIAVTVAGNTSDIGRWPRMSLVERTTYEGSEADDGWSIYGQVGNQHIFIFFVIRCRQLTM